MTGAIRTHDISVGEQHSFSHDDAGDPVHWVETFFHCSCGAEDGTWTSEATDAEAESDSIAQARAARNAAVDAHLQDVHRFSYRSSIGSAT